MPQPPRILYEHLQVLRRPAATSAAANLLVALGFVYLFRQSAPPLDLSVWLLFMALTSLARVLTARRLKTGAPASHADLIQRLNHYCLALALAGGTWGFASWWFYPVGDWGQTAVLILAILGLISGGLPTLAPHLRAFYAYIPLAVVPLIVQLLLDESPMARTFGALGILLAFLVGSAARVLHRALERSFEASLAQENLAWGLSQAKSELEERNAALSAEIERRNQTEVQLQEAKEKAESANRIKTQFLANMSHELRTPLNAVIGMSELLMQERLGPDAKDFAQIVHDQSKDLLALVNDLLDFSKIEAGGIRLDEADFSVKQELSELINSFESQARRKDLEFFATVAKKLPDVVRGDALRLRQVLSNLLSNAIKFTDQGHVRFEVRLMGRAGKGWLFRFVVEDTGVGIPSERLESIFNAFEQADGSVTRRFGGTGLGLSITKRLVEQMQGRIEAESQLGQGSRFTLDLHFNAADPDHLPPSLTNRPDLTGRRLLVVEDNQLNQKLVLKLLQPTGAVVLLAENGIEAIAKLKQEAVDLVLMDLQMPQMDGIETARLIRDGAAGTPMVPILAMTANVRPEDRRRCLESGMNGILSKPFEAQDFFEQIAALLNR